MPKVVYTAAQGLVQSAGSGFDVSTTGVQGGGFYSGFIPDAAVTAATTSGAISVANYFTNITVANTVAFTLANGTVAGQRKMILCSGTSGTPVGALTIASPFSAATDVITFSVVGDTAELMWTGSYWRILATYNMAAGTVATPVVA